MSGSRAFRKALEQTGLVVTTATTNLFSHPVFKDGGFTSNDRDVRRFALAKVMRNLDLAASLGAKIYVCWGGRDGAESGAAKDIRAALDRLKEAFDVLGAYVLDQGYDLRFAIEPKPNEPRGDILLPTVGHAHRVHQRAGAPRAGGHQPGGRARGDVRAELRARDRPGAVARQAVPHRPQRPARPAYDQDLRFGAGNARGAFWVVDVLEAGGYDGVVHFDFKPPRTEDDEGVWASAAACMRNYLILREKARAFRADPQVQEALRAARVRPARAADPGRRRELAGRPRLRARRRGPRRARHGVRAAGPAGPGAPVRGPPLSSQPQSSRHRALSHRAPRHK